MPYVDLHSHVLPALDDGAPDASISLALLRGLAGLGFAEVCATPHQKAVQFMPTAAEIDRAYQATSAAVAEAAIPLRLRLGAENFWDHVFFERSQGAGPPGYDGGRSFLFEIPVLDVPARLEETLFDLGVRGFAPVLAHPERYRPFHDDIDRLARLAGACALVVDLGALAGYHGWRVGRMAKRLVLEGIAHAAASDVHDLPDVRAAAQGIAWIKKKLGAPGVNRLLDENPRRILTGERPE